MRRVAALVLFLTIPAAGCDPCMDGTEQRFISLSGYEGWASAGDAGAACDARGDTAGSWNDRARRCPSGDAAAGYFRACLGVDPRNVESNGPTALEDRCAYDVDHTICH